jgi:Ran GTPase-activating protein (RanGAP) involved in mRNA processing and transport
MAQKGLIKNSTLEQLNISDNRIQDSGARALALAFESNKSIELLNITGNGIADEGVCVLMQVFFFFVFNLNSFRLRSCCAAKTPLTVAAAGEFWQRARCSWRFSYTATSTEPRAAKPSPKPKLRIHC